MVAARPKQSSNLHVGTGVRHRLTWTTQRQKLETNRERTRSDTITIKTKAWAGIESVPNQGENPMWKPHLEPALVSINHHLTTTKNTTMPRNRSLRTHWFLSRVTYVPCHGSCPGCHFPSSLPPSVGCPVLGIAPLTICPCIWRVGAGIRVKSGSQI